MLQNPYRSLKGKLHQLAILAVRFEQTHRYGTEIQWRENFDIDTSLCGSLISGSPWVTAKDITKSDVSQFRRLTLRSIIHHDEACREIGRRWTKLSQGVHECALVDSRFAKTALECAKVSLDPNFYTVVQG